MLNILLQIQKYLGDGPKLVRELFRVAEEHAPSIVFIDEIDAVGTKRYDSNSGGEREIQRTMLELLNQVQKLIYSLYFNVHPFLGFVRSILLLELDIKYRK